MLFKGLRKITHKWELERYEEYLREHEINIEYSQFYKPMSSDYNLAIEYQEYLIKIGMRQRMIDYLQYMHKVNTMIDERIELLEHLEEIRLKEEIPYKIKNLEKELKELKDLIDKRK